MIAIIGLGNIGNGYKNTYHNLGFMVVEELAKRLKVKFDIEKCKANIGLTTYNGEDILLAKPTTYMNNSGLAVHEIMRKYKVKIQNVLIAVDDIDLTCGKVRYREKGSAGTHNGLRSIVRETQSQDFKRIKIGTGRDESMKLEDFVLSHIDPYKREDINQAISKACDMILEFLDNNNIERETV